jgi:Vitamin B12 dependent methionine synthase, activation domain
MEPQSSGKAQDLSAYKNDIPPASRILPRLSIAPQRTEILRSLGYPPEAAPPLEVLRSVEALMTEAGAFLQPRGTYSLYDAVALTKHSLRIGGETISGNIGEFLEGARRIAVFMVTVGDAITREAKARCDSGDAFGGLVLDTIGSWAAELTAEALMVQMRTDLADGESFTLRYSPGYCGMNLDQQRVLFRLAPAGAIGISLLPSLFMQPLKSISGIVGMGPQEIVGVHLSPCERCPQVGCHMRR